MEKEELVGLVCSKKKYGSGKFKRTGKIYCRLGSYDYNKRFKNRKNHDIIYVLSSAYDGLLLESKFISKWRYRRLEKGYIVIARRGLALRTEFLNLVRGAKYGRS